MIAAPLIHALVGGSGVNSGGAMWTQLEKYEWRIMTHNRSTGDPYDALAIR